MNNEIKVLSINLQPASELAIESVCDYYKIEREELFSKSKTSNHTNKKYMAFYILKYDCDLTDIEIAELCHTTRQNINQAVAKVDVRTGLYLQSAYDYKNIKAKFCQLLKEQENWIQKHVY